MFKKIKSNTMYFNTDDEFYQFCVVPQLNTIEYINPSGEKSYYVDFDLSYEYNKAVNDGIQFVIKDENSQICKHGCVSYRTLSKPISNLKPYYKEFN